MSWKFEYGGGSFDRTFCSEKYLLQALLCVSCDLIKQY